MRRWMDQARPSGYVSIDTSTLTGLECLYRANAECTASAWEDQVTANSATEATNQPTYSATDAKFNSTPSLTFDGSNDRLTDGRANSSWDFITDASSNVEWYAWAAFSSATVALGSGVLAGIGTSSAGNVALQLSRGTNLIGLGVWNNLAQHQRQITVTANTARWIIIGHHSITGASASYLRSMGSNAAWQSTAVTRSVSAANANPLRFGCNGAGTTFGACSIVEFGVARGSLTQATATGIGMYLSSTYGCVA